MKKTYVLEELECANCAAKMEAAINKLEGVKSASINFMTQKLTLETECDDQTQILKAAQEIIKRIEPDCKITYRYIGTMVS